MFYNIKIAIIIIIIETNEQEMIFIFFYNLSLCVIAFKYFWLSNLCYSSYEMSIFLQNTNKNGKFIHANSIECH